MLLDAKERELLIVALSSRATEIEERLENMNNSDAVMFAVYRGQLVQELDEIDTLGKKLLVED